MIWCAFNGLGLALVIPCISSLVADYHPSDMRGKAFGVMGFVSAIGMLLLVVVVVNVVVVVVVVVVVNQVNVQTANVNHTQR